MILDDFYVMFKTTNAKTRFAPKRSGIPDKALPRRALAAVLLQESNHVLSKFDEMRVAAGFQPCYKHCMHASLGSSLLHFRNSIWFIVPVVVGKGGAVGAIPIKYWPLTRYTTNAPTFESWLVCLGPVIKSSKRSHEE